MDNEIIDEYTGTQESEIVTFRDVLVNAIKMQAMYSNGKIKYIETSMSSN